MEGDTYRGFIVPWRGIVKARRKTCKEDVFAKGAVSSSFFVARMRLVESIWLLSYNRRGVLWKSYLCSVSVISDGRRYPIGDLYHRAAELRPEERHTTRRRIFKAFHRVSFVARMPVVEFIWLLSYNRPEFLLEKLFTYDPIRPGPTV
ncbi:hypothetical protein CEXT_509671 [Caerostris extrusa]|uniref:Uncharacterized protein n=1 Tax=Caerostris extrusa TaxID=172846 RepID=A0AAV4U5M0_CAEEX|nr:hypothetical protein CEXT_509671 [Caerostris extrusa]